MGHAPQSFATAASERIRSGLSPKTIKNSAALLAPTPNPARRVGDVSVVSRARCRSCVAISSARANQRRASARRVYCAEDQRGKWRTALFRAIAYRHLFPFRALRCAEPAAGRARNQGSDLVQVVLIDRRVEPEHPTPSTQPVRVPEGPPSAELPKREAMAGIGVFVSQQWTAFTPRDRQVVCGGLLEHPLCEPDDLRRARF